MAYAALFCVAVAMVLRGIPYWLGLIVIVAALTSQVSSNVPAAILLSQSMTLPFAMATTYNIAMSIGNRIKQARKKRGMSCKELAALVGVTPSAITNCENGIRFPKPQVLCALFGALRVDANFLFQDYLP